jgi:GTP-binding protein
MSETPAVIAIVGRPNVGKSTFFNRLVGRHTAIVENIPGVTRDRNYGLASFRGFRFLAIDTGGFEPISEEGLLQQMRQQAQVAVEEADAVIFLTSIQDGLNPGDEEIYRYLSRHKKPIFVAANKTDHPSHDTQIAEFYQLGVEHVYGVSAAHTRGLEDLLEAIHEQVPLDYTDPEAGTRVRVALIGKPNAGKSSLINALLGEERMVVDSQAGTTRDPVDSLCRHEGKEYLLVDTAGIRRKGRVTQKIETYSIVSALKTMERSDVVLLIIDATEGVTEQVLRIGGYALDRKKAIVLVVNKWDLAVQGEIALRNIPRKLEPQRLQDAMTEELRERLEFLGFAPLVFVSAKTGKRITQIFQKVDEVYQQYVRRVSTADLNTVLEMIVRKHPPPAKSGRATKIFYGTQVSASPPTFVMVSNHPEKLNYSYERYFLNQLRYHFGFEGTPLHLIWRGRERKQN